MVQGGDEDRESHADQSHQNAMVPEGDEEKESQLDHQSHQKLQEMDLNPQAQSVQETVPGGEEPTPDQQEKIKIDRMVVLHL